MNEDRFDSVGDIYERLDGSARMHHVEKELLEITSPEALGRAREFINNIIAQNILTGNQLAKRTGVKPSAISAFRNDKWTGAVGTLYTTASELCKAIDQFLRQQEAEETNISGFVWTRFAEAVHGLVKYAMSRKKMAAFVAPAGSGKSLVLWTLKEDIPGAVLLTVTKTRSSLKSFLQLWARSLGLSEVGRAEDIQDRIVSCLFGSDRLVLIDECHKLQVGTLDLVREIWDSARIPIVLSGTPSFYTTLTSRKVGVGSSELMDQLYSRVAMYRDLTVLENPETGDPEKLFSIEDIRKVFARGHVRLVRDGVDFLCRLANSIGGGGLRTCADLVQTVADLYPGEEITATRLDMALRLKVGTREAAFRAEGAGIVYAEKTLAKTAVG